MGFKCGIVGLPNVGKSTIFNALTNAGAQAANYPFCTIDPNTGIVPVPDPRLQELDSIVHSQKVIAPQLEVVDIAGLVKGASQGEGLGNQFLSKIREVEAILHVVRCFENQDVVHVHGKVNPTNDVETIETELSLADIQVVDNMKERRKKIARTGDKEAVKEVEYLENALKLLNGELHWPADFTDKDEIAYIKSLNLLITKPVLFVANVNEQELNEDNTLVQELRKLSEKKGAKIVKICGAIEAEIAQLDDEGKKEFLKDLHQEYSGLERLIHEGYALLGLITYFTAGPKEIRGWTIPKGYTAPQAAGKIHSDFERGFIRAETIGYQDYIQNKGENGAKEAGKMRIEGKDYIVKDGDVMHFRFSV